MWIVRLALRHPYTFLVISVLLVALGLAADSVAPSSASVIVETAEVKFNLLQDHPAVVVPSRALIIHANGPKIATVDANSRVTLQRVVLGRDFGKTVEIAAGLVPGTRFVTNPTDTLRDGALVRIDAPEPTKIATK